MKKLILATVVFAASFATSASAQQAAASASDHTFTGNVSLVSDYRFRGLSQTFREPAIQGGFDYAHSSGFYIGNWNSSVSSASFPQGAGIEMDVYAGFKFEPVQDVTADIGVLYYYYPSALVAGTDEKFNNTEVYIGASYKWFSAKYSYGVSDFFGLNDTTAAGYAFTALSGRGDSKGSYYLDLNANFEIADKTVLNLHAGHQSVSSYSELSYTDYKIGVSRDVGFATLGLAIIGTDADKDYYQVSNGTKVRETGKTTAVLSLSKTF
jgi:uncharacterized protein (TIGR02001 family)